MVRYLTLVLILLTVGGTPSLRAQQVRIDVAPTTATVVNDVTTFTITPTVSAGFEASLYLRAVCPTLPGATFTFAPPRLNPPFATTAELSVTLGGARSGGDHVITIEAFNGPLVVSTACTLTLPDRPAWRVFDTSNSPMTSGKIEAMAIAPNGVGWVTTANDLLRFDGTTWTSYADEADSMGSNLRSMPIACDAQGTTVWYAYYRDVYSFDGASRKRHDLPAAYPGARFDRLIVSPTGSLWCFGTNLLLELRDGVWTDHPLTALGMRSNVRAAAVTPSNHVWMLEGYESVHRYDGTYWTTYGRAELAALGVHGHVLHLSAGPDGSVWVTCDNAVIRFDGSQPVVHPVSNAISSFPGPRPAIVHNDRTSTVWVTGSGRLGRYNGSMSWNYTTGNSGLPSSMILDITSDMQGTIWIATDKGLALLDGTAPPIKTFITSVDDGGRHASVARLSAIAPNPASGDARASLALTTPDRVTVQVVNSLGSVVATVIDGYHDAGTVPLTVDTSVLPSGAYVLVATVGAGRSHQPFAVSR